VAAAAAAAVAHGMSCIVAVDPSSSSAVAACVIVANRLQGVGLLTCVAALVTGAHYCTVHVWRTLASVAVCAVQ
jgi:hypothetical protein